MYLYENNVKFQINIMILKFIYFLYVKHLGFFVQCDMDFILFYFFICSNLKVAEFIQNA